MAFLCVGMPLKSSEVPERVPASCHTHRQRRWAVGESCAGGNPEGRGAETRRWCVPFSFLTFVYFCLCVTVTICSTVDRYLSSEVPMFFELRVRYMLACERTHEAMALALKCSQHPTVGHVLFFKQAYLCCLWKSSPQERLFAEVWCVRALRSRLFHVRS